MSLDLATLLVAGKQGGERSRMLRVTAEAPPAAIGAWEAPEEGAGWASIPTEALRGAYAASRPTARWPFSATGRST